MQIVLVPRNAAPYNAFADVHDVLVQGSCGYGDLSDRSQYPFFSAVGIPPNSDIAALPSGGCGTCIEFQCVNDRTPAFAVREVFYSFVLHVQSMAYMVWCMHHQVPRPCTDTLQYNFCCDEPASLHCCTVCIRSFSSKPLF